MLHYDKGERVRSALIHSTIALTLSALALAGCGAQSTQSSTDAGTQITVTDGVGREVVLDHPITKAVVASRYNNELIRAIGSIDKVIGVDTNTAQDRAYWSQFDPDEVIGKGQTDLNYEQIIKLAPEALITPKNSSWEQDIEKLEPAGIKVIVVTGWDTPRMEEQLDILGTVFDNKEGSDKVKTFFRENMDAVAKRVGNIQDKLSIYWEYGDDYSTAIPGTSNDGWHQMMVSAGGINIFGDPDLPSDTVDPEEIIKADPDLIMKVTSGRALKGTGVYTPPTTEEFADIAQEMAARPGWSDLKAVKNHNFYIMTGFCGGGLGKMIGTVYTAKWLYPDQMSDIDPDEIFAEWMQMQGFDQAPQHTYRYEG